MEKLGPFELNRVHCIDALSGARQLPDNSVQCCVTSPPYWGLRDYGLEPLVWDGDADCEHVWGDAPPRRSRKATDVVDMESKQATNTGAQHDLNPTQYCIHCNAWRGSLGLEPTPELYIEHMVLIFRELRRVLRADGTLWLNLGDSYVNHSQPGGGDPTIGKRNIGESKYRPSKVHGLKPKDLCGIPWRTALALQADGWWLRSDIIWAKPAPMPESVTDRPTKSHEYIFLLTKSAKYFYDADAVREAFNYPERRYQTFTEHHKTAQLKKQGNRSTAGLHDGREQYGDPAKGRNRRTVWNIATEPTPEAHFATFPEEIPRVCIKAGTSEKGACPECGKPWVRVVEKNRTFESGSGKSGRLPTGKQGPVHGGGDTIDIRRGPCVQSTTIGWKPTCYCGSETPIAQVELDADPTLLDDFEIDPHEPVPCIVLDPFAGTGKTPKVAVELGRYGIGFDHNAEYVEKFAEPRVQAAVQGITVKELEAGQGTLWDTTSQ